MIQFPFTKKKKKKKKKKEKRKKKKTTNQMINNEHHINCATNAFLGAPSPESHFNLSENIGIYFNCAAYARIRDSLKITEAADPITERIIRKSKIRPAFSPNSSIKKSSCIILLKLYSLA